MKTDASLALRAYEIGRARDAIVNALLVTLVVSGIGAATEGAHVLWWSPVTFLVWSLLSWRGGALVEGGRWGLLAGVATFLLPMSVLRPCCKPGMDMASMGTDCCTRPELCVVSGVALGFLLALSLPQRKEGRALRAVGAMLAVISVATIRCAALFWGEAIGMLGGLALGVVTVSAARLLVVRVRS